MGIGNNIIWKREYYLETWSTVFSWLHSKSKEHNLNGTGQPQSV